jgi:hypothetical protein
VEYVEFYRQSDYIGEAIVRKLRVAMLAAVKTIGTAAVFYLAGPDKEVGDRHGQIRLLRRRITPVNPTQSTRVNFRQRSGRRVF